VTLKLVEGVHVSLFILNVVKNLIQSAKLPKAETCPNDCDADGATLYMMPKSIGKGRRDSICRRKRKGKKQGKRKQGNSDYCSLITCLLKRGIFGVHSEAVKDAILPINSICLVNFQLDLQTCVPGFGHNQI
jgi:hypothetical protein